jgi:hypothetical protein
MHGVIFGDGDRIDIYLGPAEILEVVRVSRFVHMRANSAGKGSFPKCRRPYQSYPNEG